jgi:ABC-type multidrug transport system fused ATPase/permease subunit
MDGAFGFRVLINAVAGTALVAKTVPLTIVPTLLAPVAVMFVGGVLYGRLVRGLSKKQNEAQSRAMHVAEESLSLVRLVKLFNGESKAVKDYKDSLDAVYALAQSNALATGGRVTAFVAIGGGFILHVIYNCGMLISSGTLSLGQTSALAGYLLVCGNAYQGLVQSYGDMQKTLGAWERLVDLHRVEETSTITRPVCFTHALPSIKFSNVSFKYCSDDSRLVLNDLSLFVPPGANQAIVGLSGCGKSTILALLAKLYRPNLGSIHIDGRDIACIDDFDLRQNYLSFVPQETALFNTSIANNVWYPAQEPLSVDIEYQEKLSETAQLHFVSDWNSTVGERGLALSGGERQRIAIARALSTPKPVLLLDEATSALDRESDSKILRNLKHIPATKLAVTHRMSAILWSDRLTVLDAGHNVQEGPTNQLLRSPGPVLQRLLAQLENNP